MQLSIVLTTSYRSISTFFLFIICCIASFNIIAQSSQDSLWAVWQNESSPDSARAAALLKYIYTDYYYSMPDSAIILGNQLLFFTQEAALKKETVKVLHLLGYTNFRMSDYSKALEYYEQGLTLANEINYDNEAAYILLRTGYIYHENGDLVRALDYYQRSLKIFEQQEDKEGMGLVYNEFGSIYSSKKQYAKSHEYYDKTILINELQNDEIGNAPIFLNIGHLYIGQQDYEQALVNFEKGLKLYQKNDDKLGIASGLGSLGDLYALQGDKTKALTYLQESIDISHAIDDDIGISYSLMSMADIFAGQGKHDKAIKCCSESLVIAKRLGDILNQQASHECLYYSYKASGQISHALSNYEKAQLLQDSLQVENSTRKLQEIEFSNQLLADSLIQLEKQMQVEAAHQSELHRKDKNRNLAIGIGIFFLLLSGGFYSRWRYVNKSKAIIEQEKDRSEKLLLNILPAEIAEELKEKGEAAARDYDLVSILFTDFKSFTEKSENLSASELLKEINHCFMAFDHICEKYDVEKIKTIGDAFMAAGGLPVPSENSIQNTILAGLEMQKFITERIAIKEAKNEVPFEMRLGIHTGPVVAGIVGIKKFQYDIWGDTVNTASRMESHGEIGKVNISQDTYEHIKDNPLFSFESRGEIQVKGKKGIHMWFVKLA